MFSKNSVAKEKVLDDLARVAGSGVSLLSGLGRQAREDIKSRIDDAATKLDLVPREDFERLELVLQEVRKQIIEQNHRIEALENILENKKDQ